MSDAGPGSQGQPQKVQQVGKYRIVSRLGQGGMGAVYRAVDTSLDRTIALKILNSKLATNKTYVERFFREARSAAALSHPNIVGALDVGSEGGHYFFAMELVDGQTVRQRLLEKKQLSEAESVEIALQVALALEHAATKHIIHRDIKPENIMVTREGRVKLTDLGLAKATDDTSAIITQVGRSLGTAQYASPEQLRGEASLDSRTDIYSLGMTLYHVLAGAPAFEGSSPADIASKQIYDPFPRLKQSRPDVSDGLCLVIEKMCEREREHRYQTPRDLLEDLDRVKSGQPLKHAKPTISLETARTAASKRFGEGKTTSRWGRRITWGLCALGVIAAGLAAYLFLQQKRSSEVPALAPAPTSAPRIIASPTKAPAIPRPSLPSESSQENTGARHALAEARKFAEDNPDDLSKAFSLYTRVTSFTGSDEAESARKALVEISMKVRMAFENMEKETMGLASLGNFTGAFEALQSFPESYRVGDWDKNLQSFKKRCQAATEAAFLDLKAKAQQAESEHRFADAAVLYEQALIDFPADYLPKLQKELTKAAEQANQAEEQNEKLYGKFLSRQVHLWKKRSYAEAVQAAEKALDDPQYKSLRAELEMEVEHTKLLIRLLEFAEEGAKKRKGQPFEFKGKRMTLFDVRDASLLLRYGPDGPEVAVSIAKALDIQQLLDLAGPLLDAHPHKNVILGALYLSEGDLKKAEESWNAAADQRADISLSFRKLEILNRELSNKEK